MGQDDFIKAEVHMISGCKDEQTSADVSNVESFGLPDPQGLAGGACTSALLKVLYADKAKPDEDLSFQEVLLMMRNVLADDGFTQIPQLTSSKAVDVHQAFNFTPDDFTGTKRALLIGINYVGQSGELSGCHNDVHNIKEYLMDVHEFPEENITILMDDGEHTEPTKKNMEEAYKKLVHESEPGDAVFCHYSGHGGRLRDDGNDEADGYDETLIPVDYQTAGQIRDDDLYLNLVGAMPEGVQLTCLMDCCHSGTVLDLPYKFIADGSQEEMVLDEEFNFEKFDHLAELLGPLFEEFGKIAGSIFKKFF